MTETQQLGDVFRQPPTPSQSERRCSCGQAIEPVGIGTFIHWPKKCSHCRTVIEAQERLRGIRIGRESRRDKLRGLLKQKPAPLGEEIIPPLFEKSHLRRLSPKLRAAMLGLPTGRGLYLWGPCGVGKTYSMSALIRHYVLSGYQVGRVQFTRLLRELRGCYSGSGSEHKILKWVESVPRLFIEDLGIAQARETEFATRVLLEVVDYRLEHRLPMFVTSNKSLDEIESAFGERIGSRLHAACIVLPVGGADKRRSGPEKGLF
ncbi:MAG: ATP-binding protein [Sedimentisphaerales bacterium]|nr:ATP-binding protein [Sedimentisphaerales bacterium]